jgi:hypothetical protein
MVMPSSSKRAELPAYSGVMARQASGIDAGEANATQTLAGTIQLAAGIKSIPFFRHVQ